MFKICQSCQKSVDIIDLCKKSVLVSLILYYFSVFNSFNFCPHFLLFLPNYFCSVCFVLILVQFLKMGANAIDSNIVPFFKKAFTPIHSLLFTTSVVLHFDMLYFHCHSVCSIVIHVPFFELSLRLPFLPVYYLEVCHSFS